MTFLFEYVASGLFTYVNANDLYHAIKIFESYNDYVSSGKYHIYVRID